VLIDVITIFPAMFVPLMQSGVIGKAWESGIIELRAINLRDFCTDRHRVTDDYPFGGGPGLVMKPEPIFRAVRHLKKDHPQAFCILTAPGGARFDQAMAMELAQKPHLIIFCGRYRGVDERAKSLFDREVSIGDYILTGGEPAVLVMVDAIVRLLPGALGNADSLSQEAFAEGMLDSPQYTRPRVVEGMEVPEVLLSGDHQAIARWREEMARQATEQRRPDLLKNG